MIHKAKKSLGQNFLKSQPVIKKIVESGEITKEDVILEIGPGKGVLTEKLLEKSGKVIAVEKDDRLFEFLKEKFKKEVFEKKLILINEDILNFAEGEFSQVLLNRFPTDSTPRPARPDHSKTLLPLRYKIIANIPYNITGAILKKFLTSENQPERMILMVQKEVAERIMARGGKESILSISVKAYGEPKMVAKVPARYFSPAPKVDSAVIAIKNISRSNFTKNGVDETKFWKLVKAGFAHKRKKLAGNLRNLYKGDTLTNLGNKRAEELSLKDWLILGSGK